MSEPEVKNFSRNLSSSPRELTGLGENIHTLSEAVTALADRLNALALRVALMGGTNDHSPNESEAYLNRLSLLVGAAGDQMRHIQELLQLVENTASDRLASDGQSHDDTRDESQRRS